MREPPTHSSTSCCAVSKRRCSRRLSSRRGGRGAVRLPSGRDGGWPAGQAADLRVLRNERTLRFPAGTPASDCDGQRIWVRRRVSGVTTVPPERHPMSDELTPDELPLTGLRVLDLCNGPGSSASRYLADLGADVIVVDNPRHQQPGQQRDAASGLPWAFVRAAKHANKRSIALDLSDDSDDLDAFWDLAQTCDIVFEDSPPGAAGNVVSARALRARLPHAVVVALTDFGQSGPYRDWAGTEAVHAALSSELSRSGPPGRTPLLPPVRIATESAAVQA